MNSNNPDVGEANDEIEVSIREKREVWDIMSTYLTDAVEVIDEERIELEIGAGMKPGSDPGGG